LFKFFEIIVRIVGDGNGEMLVSYGPSSHEIMASAVDNLCIAERPGKDSEASTDPLETRVANSPLDLVFFSARVSHSPETDYLIGEQRFPSKSGHIYQRDISLQSVSNGKDREKCPDNAQFQESTRYQSDNNDLLAEDAEFELRVQL
jgi:hypothetical protein